MCCWQHTEPLFWQDTSLLTGGGLVGRGFPVSFFFSIGISQDDIQREDCPLQLSSRGWELDHLVHLSIDRLLQWRPCGLGQLPGPVGPQLQTWLGGGRRLPSPCSSWLTQQQKLGVFCYNQLCWFVPPHAATCPSFGHLLCGRVHTGLVPDCHHCGCN